MHEHLTGWAAVVAAIALLLHAARAALPEVAKAMRVRADALWLDAGTRAQIELDRRAAAADLRTRLTKCDEDRAASATASVLGTP